MAHDPPAHDVECLERLVEQEHRTIQHRHPDERQLAPRAQRLRLDQRIQRRVERPGMTAGSLRDAPRGREESEQLLAGDPLVQAELARQVGDVLLCQRTNRGLRFQAKRWQREWNERADPAHSYSGE